MFARIGSRHFAHLYMSGLLRLRFRLRRGLRYLPLERGRHDRPVRPTGEDVAASAARPDARRFPTDRDRGAPWTRVPPFQTLLDLLHSAADSHSVAGPKRPTMPAFRVRRAMEDLRRIEGAGGC